MFLNLRCQIGADCDGAEGLASAKDARADDDRNLVNWRKQCFKQHRLTGGAWLNVVWQVVDIMQALQTRWFVAETRNFEAADA